MHKVKGEKIANGPGRWPGPGHPQDGRIDELETLHPCRGAGLL